jgi:hypothetical protein
MLQRNIRTNQCNIASNSWWRYVTRQTTKTINRQCDLDVVRSQCCHPISNTSQWTLDVPRLRILPNKVSHQFVALPFWLNEHWLGEDEIMGLKIKPFGVVVAFNRDLASFHLTLAPRNNYLQSSIYPLLILLWHVNWLINWLVVNLAFNTFSDVKQHSKKKISRVQHVLD